MTVIMTVILTRINL